MNKQLGFISSIIVATCVFLFGVTLVLGFDNLSYLVCIFLSWGYVLLAASFIPEIEPNKKSFAYGGLAFATVYVVFINFVYYTQLTTVLQQSASAPIIQVLSFQHLGSLAFNFDLFGYGIMAISTFLIGLALVSKTKSDKWLKGLMTCHGIFAISSIALPLLGVFSADMEGGDWIGTLALLFWCIYFIPIGVLSAIHFKRQ